MNLIVFKTAAEAPLALLLLSTPAAPLRDCIFRLHPAMSMDDFRAREGEVVFPDRTTEYRCSYATTGDETLIEFENQIGWKFVVRMGTGGSGTWSAERDAETISGIALEPRVDCSMD